MVKDLLDQPLDPLLVHFFVSRGREGVDVPCRSSTQTPTLLSVSLPAPASAPNTHELTDPSTSDDLKLICIDGPTDTNPLIPPNASLQR